MGGSELKYTEWHAHRESSTHSPHDTAQHRASHIVLSDVGHNAYSGRRGYSTTYTTVYTVCILSLAAITAATAAATTVAAVAALGVRTPIVPTPMHVLHQHTRSPSASISVLHPHFVHSPWEALIHKGYEATNEWFGINKELLLLMVLFTYGGRRGGRGTWP